MPSLTTVLLILVATTFSFSQDFCGHIKYRYTYLLAKNNKNVTEKTKKTKIEDFYICGNKFKVLFDGKLGDIFIGDSLMYYIVDKEKIGYVKADSSYGQQSPEYKNLKTNVTYNNKVYNTIELDEVTYYFSDEVKIDPATFEQLKLFYWNKFFNATNGGICLVSISRSKKLITISEAIEIDKIEIPEKEFIPPKQYELRHYGYFKVFN